MNLLELFAGEMDVLGALPVRLMAVVGTGLLSYLLGAVPFSLLIGFFFGQDIRSCGSGNTGATNLARVVNYGAGVCGLALDFLKGFAPAFWGGVLVQQIAGPFPAAELIWLHASYGFLAIVGHCFPVYLRFDGGKGVATSLGVFVAIMPVVTLAAFLFWGIVALTSGWVSLASILAAVMIPVFYLTFAAVLTFCPSCGQLRFSYLTLSILASVLVVARHHENIRRLWKGEERKFLDAAKDLEEA